jgi:hypothetical protein
MPTKTELHISEYDVIAGKATYIAYSLADEMSNATCVTWTQDDIHMLAELIYQLMAIRTEHGLIDDDGRSERRSSVPEADCQSECLAVIEDEEYVQLFTGPNGLNNLIIAVDVMFSGWPIVGRYDVGTLH